MGIRTPRREHAHRCLARGLARQLLAASFICRLWKIRINHLARYFREGSPVPPAELIVRLAGSAAQVVDLGGAEEVGVRFDQYLARIPIDTLFIRAYSVPVDLALICAARLRSASAASSAQVGSPK